MPVVRMSSGKRKYTPIWAKIKAQGFCIVTCPRIDTQTIINGVKREKVKDKSKPKKKLLICDPTETGIHFRLIEDNSINNL